MVLSFRILNTVFCLLPAKAASELDLNDRGVDLGVCEAIGVVGQRVQCDDGNDFQDKAVIDPGLPRKDQILV
jgi:hypothetical protein